MKYNSSKNIFGGEWRWERYWWLELLVYIGTTTRCMHYTQHTPIVPAHILENPKVNLNQLFIADIHMGPHITQKKKLHNIRINIGQKWCWELIVVRESAVLLYQPVASCKYMHINMVYWVGQLGCFFRHFVTIIVNVSQSCIRTKN